MKKLHIELANCYGIKSLKTDLDFTQHKAFAVYAPNGVMKSSLAHTFKDVADDVPSKDVIFPARVSLRTITDEKGTAPQPSPWGTWMASTTRPSGRQAHPPTLASLSSI